MSHSGLAQILLSIRETLSRPVSNTSIVNSKMLKFKVINAKCGIVNFEAPESENGSFVKRKAVELFSKSSKFPFSEDYEETSTETVNKFQLIRVKTRQEIKDSHKLQKLKIEKGEEFLLNIRKVPIPDPLEKLNLRGPTLAEIMEKTKHLPKSKPRPPAYNIEELLYLDDMRKVFVTLAQESAKVLGTTPYANELIRYYRQRILNCMKNDKNAVKVMTQLGFTKDRVEYAMTKHANDYKLALDWLITNETPGNYDESLFDDPDRRRSSLRDSQVVTSARFNSVFLSKYTPKKNVSEKIDDLLEIVNFFSDRDELVYEDHKDEMVAMGYTSEISHNALKVTRNNIPSAIALIEGEDTPSVFELRAGLQPGLDIRKKLLESPQIQESLGKPKIFSYFIEILNSPSQSMAWNPFSEGGTLLKHIIVTYHDEKRVIASNQFNQSRFTISALSAPNQEIAKSEKSN